MRKRKAKAVRRSPYERSLEHATNRLNRAIAERETYALKLADLDREIPYLQGVIRALTPPEETPRLLVTGNTASKVNAIPDHLKRFIKPVDNGIVLDQSEPFIPDVIPGEEILP